MPIQFGVGTSAIAVARGPCTPYVAGTGDLASPLRDPLADAAVRSLHGLPPVSRAGVQIAAGFRVLQPTA